MRAIEMLMLGGLAFVATVGAVVATAPSPAPTVRINTGAAPVVEPLKIVCSTTGEVAIFYRNDEGREFGPVVTGERCRYVAPQ